MANGSDGHIVLGVQIDNQGIKKGANTMKSMIGKLGDSAKQAGIKIQSAFNFSDSASSNVRNLSQAIKDQKYVIKSLNDEYAKLLASGRGGSKQAQELKERIALLKKELREVEGALTSVSGKKRVSEVNLVGKAFQNLGKRIMSIAKSALIFSVLYRVLRALVDIIKSVAMGNSDFRDSVARLQAALWTLATPLLAVIIPALKTFIDLLTRAAVAVGKFFAAISGKSYASLVKNAKALKQQSDAYKELEKNAKEAKKQLASFDDLEILTRNETDGGIAGPDFETLKGDIAKEEYESKLVLIGMVAGTALVGLGIIMMFSGHLFTGIAMVATGYAVSSSSVSSASSLGNSEKKKLAKIGAITGTALIGLGVLLLFTALHWKYGLAMIATGAMLVYQAYSLGEFSEDIKSMVIDIVMISGAVAFTLGVILLFINVAGIWKYGLGLMALGVAEVIGASALSGEELKGELQTFVLDYWKEIYAISALMMVVGIVLLLSNAKATWKYALTLVAGSVTALVSTTLLGGEDLKTELQNFALKYWKEVYAISALIAVVGIVLLFCKQWKYGFTLLIASIALVATTNTLGGKELKAELKTFVDKYWAEIYGISALIVIVGVVLLFCKLWGVGLTLIVAGIVTMYEAAQLGGEDVKKALYDATYSLKEELAVMSAALFVIGTLLLFVPGCLGVGITLLAAGAAGLFGVSKLDSSKLSSELTTHLNNVNDTAKQGVNKINNTLSGIKFSGGGSGGGTRGVNVSLIPINGYARGTVVPPNKPHLAWFGDNTQEPEIVSPVSTMKKAFAEAMIEMGGNIGGSGNTEVVLEIDGREFGRAVVEQGNRENRRIGTRLVIA